MDHPKPVVFIVDDDEAVRDSLRLLFKSVGLVSKTYHSATDFLEAFDPEQPGCLVLDVRMPGLSGLDLQRELTEKHAILPIIFISGHGDIPMAVKAMRDGAVDFIQKPFRDQELIDRIHEALKLDAENRVQIEQYDAIRLNFEKLTAREREVLDSVIKGKANKVIAADINVSQRTVEVHRANGMEKMQAKSVAHLVRMMMTLESQTDE